MRRVQRFLQICPLLCGVLFTLPVSAQSAADKAAARALADEADAAMATKNFGTAAEKYQKALGLVPDALTLRLGLARAQAGVGKYLEATESYNVIIRTPLSATAPAPFRAAQKDAEKEIADASKHVGAVVISIVGRDGKAPTAGLALSLDDEAVPAALIGERRPANPGRHMVRVRAEGYEPAESRVEVKEAGVTPITITLVPAKVIAAPVAAPPSSAAPVVAPSPPPEAPPAPPNRTPAYVALGLGGAGLVVGTVAGAIAVSKHGSLTDKCEGGCPPGSQSDIDSYRTAGAISTVSFVIGGVGVASGAVLWLLAAPSPPPQTGTAPGGSPARATWKVAPFVSPTSAGVFGSF